MLQVVVEEEILGPLHRLVEKRHRCEMAIHQGVEQPVPEKADPVDGQVRRFIPATDHGIDVDRRALAHGDEGLGRDEGRQLVGGQLAGFLVEGHRVGAE